MFVFLFFVFWAAWAVVDGRPPVLLPEAKVSGWEGWGVTVCTRAHVGLSTGMIERGMPTAQERIRNIFLDSGKSGAPIGGPELRDWYRAAGTEDVMTRLYQLLISCYVLRRKEALHD